MTLCQVIYVTTYSILIKNDLYLLSSFYIFGHGNAGDIWKGRIRPTDAMAQFTNFSHLINFSQKHHNKLTYAVIRS